MKQKVNNCWQILRNILYDLFSKKDVWRAVKLVLSIVRIACKIIDAFQNGNIDN